MNDDILVVVNDKSGYVEDYVIKSDPPKEQKPFNVRKYFKEVKYEKPKEEFGEMFEQENDISYNPEYFRENLEL